jgi:uncharacterized membrane protein YobD (UPF0266 family)
MKKMHLRFTRDGVIFVSGLAILFHETALTDNPTERPQLLIVAAMMIGLPAFLRKDETQTQKPELPKTGDRPNGSGGSP